MTSIASPFVAFLKSTIRRWLTARGFALVLVAALFPALFVGAWAGTHRADVGVTELAMPEGEITPGQMVNFTATFGNTGRTRVESFNASVQIFQDVRFPLESETQLVEGLAPGETRTVTLSWNATAGPFIVAALADIGEGAGSGDIGERDENNNLRARVLQVANVAPPQSPTPPPGVNGTANATSVADLVVESVTWTPQRPSDAQTQINITATFRNAGAERVDNATGAVRVSRIVAGRSVTVADSPQPISLDAGATTTVTFAWTWQPGSFWAEGYATPPGGEADPSNNHKFEPLVLDQVVDPALIDQIERPEEATFKSYYQGVIIAFYLALVVPLIALFYAAGVISDERDAGTLPYLLTRPIPRWLIPVTKWIAGFVVISLATVVGLTISYFVMFGTVAGATGSYLTAPIVLTLLALAAYLALFVFLGTYSTRPYILGMLFVLAWETVAARIVVETTAGTQPLLPWVGNLTVLQHLNNALNAWDLDAGLQWLPTGEGGTRALLVLLGIVVVGLAAAAMWMRKRDFQVG